MTEPWLTAEDVAGILKIHIDDVYRLMASGEIPARKFGRRWRVPPGELEKLGGVTPSPRVPRPRRPAQQPETSPPPPRRKPAASPPKGRRGITLRDLLDN